MTKVLLLRAVFGSVAAGMGMLLAAIWVVPAGAGVDVWTNEGPEGAEITAVTVDPGDAQIVYVGTNGGGVFKSTDAGSTWLAARTGLGAAQVRQIDIDPNDRQTLYATTASTTSNRFQGGLYKSTDGGSTWNAADEGLGDEFISDVVIDARNPGTLYAGVGHTTEGGLFKSTDGAQLWTRIFGEAGPERDVVSIGLDPSDSQVIYVSTRAGLLKTVNGGTSWEPAGSGLPSETVAVFAFDPLDNLIVYAGLRGGFLPSGVYKTTNGGESWEPTGGEIGSGVRDLIADTTSGTLYALQTEGVFKTTDGGAHWPLMNEGLPPRRFRFNALALAASDTQRLIVGMGPAAPAPVYRSNDAAATWQAAGVSGLTNTFLLSLAVDPVAPQVRYATAEVDNVNTVLPLLKTETAGTVWVRSDVGLPNAQIVVVDPVESNLLYAGTPTDGVYKSTNAGTMWQRANLVISGNFIACLTIDPSDRQTLYACVRGRQDRKSLFKSSNGGGVWEAVTDGLQDVGAKELAIASSVAVDRATPTTVYAATLEQGVFKSTNGGQSWNPADLGLVPTDLNALAVDPSNPSIVYAGARVTDTGEERSPGGVYKSIDAGASWQPANGGEGQILATADVRAVAIDATRPQVVYAASDMGVFRSTDGAASWTQLDDGLFSPDVRALVIDPLDADILHVATFGGGVFSIEQTCGDGVVPCPVTPMPTATPTQTPAPPACDGDCDDSGIVTLDELVRGVRIALELAAATDCLSVDGDRDGHVTIDELVRAVDRALKGC